jgi:hypothetical protein
MTSDIADKFMPESTYKRMVNCRSNNKNSKAGGVVENIPSTLAITPPAFGQTVTYVGGCVDSKRNAIIAFYRGTTPSTLFITSLNTKTKQEVFVLYTTLVNVSKRVTHVVVMDDFLFWIDGAYKMRKINIVTATAAPTTAYISSDQMLIDKFPPLYPPLTQAVTDAAFQGNNISKDIFQFAYAWEYKDKEVSSWSPYSKSVLPESTGGAELVYPNNRINLFLKTGSDDVKKIHVAFRKGASKSWQLCDILDKDHITIAGGETTYAFYNAKLISSLIETDIATNTNNPFHEAGTLALSRDNFIIYGLIKDGLTKPTDIVLNLAYQVKSSAAKVGGYKFGATHQFGVVFRDENGRTDGVNAIEPISIPFITEAGVYSTALSIIAGGNIPYAEIEWSVTGTAPSWAKTMSIVYLGNKSIATFVDYVLSGIEDNGIYTYIDLKALNTLKDTVSVLEPAIPNSNISPYTFTKGDRIRFKTTKEGVLLNGVYDYEILGYVSEIADSAGNILYPDMLYVNKISNWAALSIDKGSIFEIYTPKKEFADSVFLEVAEVYPVSAGLPITQEGFLVDGDIYAFNRDTPLYDIGELVADKDTLYDYTGRVGFTPVLNVIKSAEDVRATAYTQNESTGAFYLNTSGVSKKVQVVVDYEFTSESNDGYQFQLKHKFGDAEIGKWVIFSEGNHPTLPTSGRIVYHKGTFTQLVNNVLDQHALSIYFQNNNDNASHLIFRTAPKITVSVKISDLLIGDSIVTPIESKDYSDYFESDEHSLGRPYVEIPNEETDFKNVIAYTEKLFPDTDINDTNRLNSINIKQVPSGFGLISAMMVRGDVLKVLTPYKELSYYLGKEQYSDSKTTDNFLLSSNPIGTVNVYDSDHGTENPESLMSNANSLFYYDRKNATIVQSSNNGQVDIAEYGLKTYLREVTARINSATESNVFIANNDKGSEIVIVFVIDGVQETVVFKNQDNLWSHFLELEDASGNAPQGTCSLGETLAIYLQGNAYLAEQGNGYNTFFGDSKSAVIETVSNQEPVSTKIFQSLNYQGVGKWNVQVATEATDENPYGMYTQITKGRQRAIEGTYSSDISPNLKTKTGTINPLWYAIGMPMRGKVATLTLTNEDTTRVVLDELTVGYINSQNM